MPSMPEKSAAEAGLRLGRGVESLTRRKPYRAQRVFRVLRNVLSKRTSWAADCSTHLALTALDGVTRMASPTYGLDVIALVFAFILAAGIVLLVARLVPSLADLIMPPPLIGSTI
jgi:hypothetical protein